VAYYHNSPLLRVGRPGWRVLGDSYSRGPTGSLALGCGVARASNAVSPLGGPRSEEFSGSGPECKGPSMDAISRKAGVFARPYVTRTRGAWPRVSRRQPHCVASLAGGAVCLWRTPSRTLIPSCLRGGGCVLSCQREATHPRWCGQGEPIALPVPIGSP